MPAWAPVSLRDATYNQFYVMLGQLASLLHPYFLRRGELMRQIEQRGIQQLKKNSEQ